MKYLIISLLMMCSVSTQAMTTPPTVYIKPILVCIGGAIYFYVNLDGEVYIIPYKENGEVGLCDV